MPISEEATIAVMQADIKSMKSGISELKDDICDARKEISENSKAIIRVDSTLQTLVEAHSKVQEHNRNKKDSGIFLTPKELFLAAVMFGLALLFIVEGSSVGGLFS